MSVHSHHPSSEHELTGTCVGEGDSHAASFAVTRALSHSVTGPNPLEAPGQQTITLRMDQWDIEFGTKVRFKTTSSPLRDHSHT
jgi:hypothetical protein